MSTATAAVSKARTRQKRSDQWYVTVLVVTAKVLAGIALSVSLPAMWMAQFMPTLISRVLVFGVVVLMALMSLMLPCLILLLVEMARNLRVLRKAAEECT